MKLKNEHKSILKSHGYDDWDLQQIEIASKYMKYMILGEPATKEEIMKILGIEDFLLGLATATFLSYADREIEDGFVNFEGKEFHDSNEWESIYSGDLDSIKLHEVLYSKEEDYESTTLYFYAPSRFIASDVMDKSIIGAYITLEYPLDRKEASESYIDICAICKYDEELEYEHSQEINPPYEFINRLFEIEERLRRNGEPISEKTDDNMSFLTDGVTECCGYDFKAETDRANYCPVCGRKLVCR